MLKYCHFSGRRAYISTVEFFSESSRVLDAFIVWWDPNEGSVISYCYFAFYLELNIENLLSNILLISDAVANIYTAIQSSSPEVLWSYLTSRHSWARISNWIQVFQSTEPSASWPTLTAEIVNQNTCCSRYMRNEILDKLAR